jgi:hypothetical protein
MAILVEGTQEEPGQGPRQGSWLERLRSGLGDLNILIVVLLAAMLLPLIVGPFVLVYEFASAGAYARPGLIGTVFGACALLVLRAVRRGEFGPPLFGAALVLVAFMFFMASRLPH